MIDTTLDPIFSIFPITASIISLILSISLFKDYRSEKKSYYALWGASFFFFFIATIFEGISPIFGWFDITYRLYYISAVLLVYFLGAGQLNFMISRKILFKQIYGTIFSVYGLIIIGLMIIFGLITSVNTSELVGVIPGGVGWGEEFSLAGRSIMRIFSPLMTIPGSLLIIGGTIISFALDKHNYILLITLGAVLLAGAGSLASLFNITLVQFFVELIGIVLLYIGFRISKSPH
jgi:hypothetical protein